MENFKALPSDRMELSYFLLRATEGILHLVLPTLDRTQYLFRRYATWSTLLTITIARI